MEENDELITVPDEILNEFVRDKLKRLRFNDINIIEIILCLKFYCVLVCYLLIVGFKFMSSSEKLFLW